MSALKRDIEGRFSALNSLLIQAFNTGYPIQHLQQELAAVKMGYSLMIAGNEMQLVVDESQSADHLEEIARIIQSENFHHKVQDLATRVIPFVQANPMLHQLARTLSEASGIPPAVVMTGYYNCSDCGTEMSLVPESVILNCTQCHRITTLEGTVSSDSQFFPQEGQKGKSGGFKPNKHFRSWMDQILGTEPETKIGDKNDPDNIYGEKVIALIEQCISRYDRYREVLTVKDIRKMLSNIQRTDLNNHCTQILRRTTGRTPPDVSNERIAHADALFSQVLQARTQIQTKQINRRYYPFYIYKIFENIIPEGDPEREVLEFIHMQGGDTVAKCDEEWKQICDIVSELTWRPTRRR